MLLRPVGADVSDPNGPTARLGYCLNLHPAESIDDVLHALRRYAAGVRDRVHVGSGEPFGVGMYLGPEVARTLSNDDAALGRLVTVLREERLDPFTFNAFPYGKFQRDGLKEHVYSPTWAEIERLVFTVDVAQVAAKLWAALGRRGSHVSISTHPGAYGPSISDRSLLSRCAENFGRAVGELARIEESTGVRIVLSLEAEPDASSRNSRALAEFNVLARLVGGRILEDEFSYSANEAKERMRRHLGTCLDACHSAVEFESAAEAREFATHEGPVGKLQFSSALRLVGPAGRPEAQAALLGLDEPRFLHQVTANSAPASRDSFLHLPDLPALRDELEDVESDWQRADEWRCHFHVPVDLPDAGGLETTRDHADELLRELLSSPWSWGTRDLHVEIETYTWDVLPEAAGAASSEAELVAGLAREYDHVLETFEACGWDRVRGT